ncbi:PD-(D/E)XK nuclease family protein [Prevotella sp. P6B1]|uniref:PD-(D/E)XK nuclease family protein n=1 Tax=Prevotella sp. P6B1 TaxID=1410613 RepID=UPI00051BDFAC|nr:PD-(D/E)XK nuclease family protein [Prevotella sp. P6B1]
MKQQVYPIIRFPEKGTVLYPYRRHPLVQPGAIEQHFARELSAKLPAGVECILNACIITTDKQPPYYPDLALVVAGRPDIRIDVEIDEPYQKSTREPIHYQSCGDVFRDHLLNRHGWTVVRLAVQQITQEASICADYLVELLSAMTADMATAGQHVFTSVPFPVEPWSRHDALKMAYWQKVAGEDRQWIVDRYALDEQELKCKPLVRPFEKTDDMCEKMATFRDAGCYEQDAFIDFEPEEHIYIYKGIKRMLPVSSLIAYFYDEFQPLSQAENQLRYKGIPVEECLDKWAKAGRLASEVGTFVHLQTENYFQRGFFETECQLQFGSETEVVNVEQEKLHFLRFIRDYDIEPYRQEWPVYDKDLNIAGTIDLICQNDDGEFTIYDWKRSSKVVNAQGQPIVEGFRGKMSHNGISLPDTSFYHYCIQQNLYRYMLERHYGIRIKAMNLVVLCPDYPTYYVAQVPKMDQLIQQIVTICQQRDLGHRLLL